MTHLLEDLMAARGADPIGDVARTLIIRIYDRLDPRQGIGVTRPHARGHTDPLHGLSVGGVLRGGWSPCCSWTGLGRWATAVLDALGLDRVHLVVHDIGGPVGFELAAAVPDRVRSLLLLNTTVAVDTFRRPWVMEPFAHRFVGEIWLAAARQPVLFRRLMRMISCGPGVPAAEIDAHLRLLLGDDGGRAFLRIMRSFERTVEKRRRYEAVVGARTYPVGLLWGSRDPALPMRTYGVQARLAARLDDLPGVPGKHFLQEDFPAEVAAAVAALALRASQ